MSHRFLEPALVELAEGMSWYEEKRPGLGGEFREEVASAVGRVEDHPRAWVQIAPGIRRAHVRRFPYSVVYTVEPDGEILILAVMHEKRHPESWRDRRLR